MLRRTLLVVVLVALSGAVSRGQEPKKEDTKKGPYKARNDQVSDFADNPGKYGGQTLTFRMKFTGAANMGMTLKQLQGGLALLEGIDSNNGAKLVLHLNVFRMMDVPNAQNGEELIVTFKAYNRKKPEALIFGEAIEIRRPTKEDDRELKQSK